MGKTFDHECETAEAQKFNTLAVAFDHTDTRGLSERFSILAALCEEKAKILKELVAEVVFEVRKPEGKMIEWPSPNFQRRKRVGDN